MATRIATWDDLKHASLTGARCPTKAEILANVAAGYTVAVEGSYSDNQLVKVGDVTYTAARLPYICFEALTDGYQWLRLARELADSYGSIEYSYDKQIWKPMTYSEDSDGYPTGTSAGFTKEKPLYLRGKNTRLASSAKMSSLFYFSSDTVLVKVSGDLMALYDWERLPDTFPIGTNWEYFFAYLFNHFYFRGYDEDAREWYEITTAPIQDAGELHLPSNTGRHCYLGLFANNTHLVTPPQLPAKELSFGCYDDMFTGCGSLVRAPELPANVLVENAYTGMFHNCVKLNWVKCLATDISAESCTNFWLWNVAPTGIFFCPESMVSVWTRDYHGIPSGWTIETI